MEECGLGATQHFLKDLLYMARRRGLKLIYVSHSLPPLEVLSNFTLLLFDMGPLTARVVRELRLPIPLSSLKVGEAWLITGPGLPKKVKFPLWGILDE